MNEPNFDLSRLFATLTPASPENPPHPLGALGELLALSPQKLEGAGFWAAIPSLPDCPSRWRRQYFDEVIERCNKRIDVLLDRVNGVTAGRVMPDLDQVTIGTGKRFSLAVLFLDICHFSDRPNWSSEEQKRVLVVMNIFMAEMLNIVRDFGGTYEKNTGDGLMAYFGDGESTDEERVRPAVEAATVMHCINDQLITPWLQKQNIEPVVFRIGIDVGPVTIARVGLRGEENSRVAIGTVANIACKLMKLIPEGGICIGHAAQQALPANWDRLSQLSSEPTGFVYSVTGAPYPAWELNHRLTRPIL